MAMIIRWSVRRSAPLTARVKHMSCSGLTHKAAEQRPTDARGRVLAVALTHIVSGEHCSSEVSCNVSQGPRDTRVTGGGLAGVSAKERLCTGEGRLTPIAASQFTHEG
ncbi:unnamed protein product [Merluccius merluccius]